MSAFILHPIVLKWDRNQNHGDFSKVHIPGTSDSDLIDLEINLDICSLTLSQVIKVAGRNNSRNFTVHSCTALGSDILNAYSLGHNQRLI